MIFLPLSRPIRESSFSVVQPLRNKNFISHFSPVNMRNLSNSFYWILSKCYHINKKFHDLYRIYLKSNKFLISYANFRVNSIKLLIKIDQPLSLSHLSTAYLDSRFGTRERVELFLSNKTWNFSARTNKNSINLVGVDFSQTLSCKGSLFHWLG